jgi:CubicO group peptidase (beta-lactamase class C family)
MKTAYFALPVLVVLALPIQGRLTISPAKAGMDSQRLETIRPTMKSFVDRGTISGVVTLVARHGVLASLEAIGYQDLESKRPMQTDTIFQMMSMTKPITVTGLMMLVEEGKVSLSDPVMKYLPEFEDMWVIEKHEGSETRCLRRPSRQVTIQNLLTHTSGLGGLPEGFHGFAKVMAISLDEDVAVGARRPLNFDPGTKWQYSGVGIDAVGKIIQIVSGQPYENFLETRLFEPLGMKDTFFFPPASKYDRLASVYDMEKGALKVSGPDTPGGVDLKYRKGAENPIPSGGLFSTAIDLYAFYQMMLDGGTYHGKRILSKATVAQMTTVHTGNLPVFPEMFGESGQGSGLGWFVNRVGPESKMLPFTTVGTFSHAGALTTQAWIDRKNDLIGIFLIQRWPDTYDERNAFLSIVASAIQD